MNDHKITIMYHEAIDEFQLVSIIGNSSHRLMLKDIAGICVNLDFKKENIILENFNGQKNGLITPLNFFAKFDEIILDNRLMELFWAGRNVIPGEDE